MYVALLVHMFSLMWCQLKTKVNITDFNTSVIKALLWRREQEKLAGKRTEDVKNLQGKEQ